MYCLIFIHSSVDGHLGCFNVLDIVNSAAMKIEVYVSFQLKEFSVLILKKFSLLYGQKF